MVGRISAWAGSASVRELRFIIGAKMGQTMRHSVPIYANAHVDVSMKKGARALLLWGLGAFFCSYSSTIGVCKNMLVRMITRTEMCDPSV